MVSVEQYQKQYSTFSGCDIVAAFNGKIIGELQAITYSVSREKAPVYTLGSAEPRSFSRGKRGIAGTLVLSVFNRDALIQEFKPILDGQAGNLGVQKFKANAQQDSTGEFLSVEDWDAAMNEYSGRPGSTMNNRAQVSDLLTKTEPRYADEILPFDITITMANEYGSQAVLVIYGVELLNEGSGFSVDSVVSEKAYTFIARRVDYLRSINAEDSVKFSATF